jgi:hypothetical protein
MFAKLPDRQEQYGEPGGLIMGSTIQIFIAGIALLVNTLVLIVMTFLSNIIMAPIIGAMGKFVTGNQAVPMSDMTWIIQVVWVTIALMEIVCIISFLAVVSRRNEVGYETYY